MTTLEYLKLHLDVCNTHVARLEKIFGYMQSLLPIKAEDMDHLSDETLNHLDSMSYRFVQLQNTISEKIFPKILEALEEDTRSKSFIDIMNRLEKLGILESVQFWKDMRDARNDVVHDYPVDDKTKAECINDCVDKGKKLIEFYAELKRYIQNIHE